MAMELEREDYLRKALVADVAHELRTPLAIIRAQIDAISMGIADFSPETLGSLSDETDRLTRFVDDLAVLAAVDAAGLRLERERVDMANCGRGGRLSPDVALRGAVSVVWTSTSSRHRCSPTPDGSNRW